VGEVKVIGYLVDYLLAHRPELKIHVTTMTMTGYNTARAGLGDRAGVSVCPLDAIRPMRRFLDCGRPRALVVAETEIWPNLLTEAVWHGAKIVLVNGRLSERALGKYRLIGGTIKSLLLHYDRIFPKTEADRDRFVSLGAPPDKLTVTGDMKFDAPLLPRPENRVRELRARLGTGDHQFLLLCGSTRPGEEQQIIEVYRRIKSDHPRLRLALAPRHPHRADEVAALVTSAGLTCNRFSAAETPGNGTAPDDAVALVDVMGMLGELYTAADLAFVGGTLVPIGGHNVLEPVWAGTPVVFGPHLANVTEAAEYIVSRHYGVCVRTADALAELVTQMLAGERAFDTRSSEDLQRSPTAGAGDYILELLRHA